MVGVAFLKHSQKQSLKIQILNSPFNFDEVGQKTAQRWIKQGKADLTADGALMFRPFFSSSQTLRQREDDNFDRAVTGKFEWYVGDSGGSRLMKQYEGISGGTRVFQAAHGN